MKAHPYAAVHRNTQEDNKQAHPPVGVSSPEQQRPLLTRVVITGDFNSVEMRRAAAHDVTVVVPSDRQLGRTENTNKVR